MDYVTLINWTSLFFIQEVSGVFVLFVCFLFCVCVFVVVWREKILCANNAYPDQTPRSRSALFAKVPKNGTLDEEINFF